MPAAPSITSLQSVIAGLASGSSKAHIIGTRHSGPTGIESIIEYRSPWPVYLNVVDWYDTFLVITINGIDSADLRSSAQPNPGEDGETPNDPLWGGRTVILSGKQYAHTIWKLRDMQQGLRAAFLDVHTEYPLIFHAADPADDLMIMCRLADKISLPDQQTTRNEYVRDFQIPLRASNPRFLSVVREIKSVLTVTQMTADFNVNVTPPTIEDFTLAGGLSSGYVAEGDGYTVDSGYLVPKPNSTGSLMLKNEAADPDFERSDLTYAGPAFSIATAKTMGGALDNGPYYEYALDMRGGIKPYGAGFAFNAAAGTVLSASFMARVPSGIRSGIIQFQWYPPGGGATIDAEIRVSDPFTITSEWQTFAFNNVVVPADAGGAIVDFRVTNPQANDVLHLDKKIAVKAATVSYFDQHSEFADYPNNIWIGERYYYQRYTAPRTWTEDQQTVKFLTASDAPSAAIWNPLHLGMAYLDEDNQIYVGFTISDSLGSLGIFKRRFGVETRLAGANQGAITLNPSTNYWLRGRLHDGIVFFEIYNADPWANTAAAAALAPFKTYQYTLTPDEIATFQAAPTHLTLGVAEAGAQWKIDEWRYGDMIEPKDWSYLQGDGTMAISNNKLSPLTQSLKALYPTSQTKVGDATVTAKVRYETSNPGGVDPLIGFVVKGLDRDNFIYAVYYGRGAGSITTATLVFKKYESGVTTQLSSMAGQGGIPVATDIWIRCVVIGNNISLYYYTGDPALGGAQDMNKQSGFTLSGADAIKYGAGVKGYYGIALPTPIPYNITIDDFKMDVASYDDIAYQLVNKGNYKAQTTIELTGPMTNPRVTNETNGTSFLINGAIPAGETWVLQNDGPIKRFYRKSDGANRFTYLDSTSMWIMLEPNGVVNNIRLTASALVPGWDMLVQYRHTYM
jgi:hypothetical protein